MQVWTTLNKIKRANPCPVNYHRGLKAAKQRGVKGNDKIDIVDIADVCGIDDALWLPESILHGSHISKRYWLFVVACCQDILHLINDRLSIDAGVASHLYAHGEIDGSQLAAARAAARAAVRAAAWAAAWDADRAAAKKRFVEHFKIIFSTDFDD